MLFIKQNDTIKSQHTYPPLFYYDDTTSTCYLKDSNCRHLWSGKTNSRDIAEDERKTQTIKYTQK